MNAEEEKDRIEEKADWKTRFYMFLFWAIVLLLVSQFFLDFFPFSMPVWGDWRFLIGK